MSLQERLKMQQDRYSPDRLQWKPFLNPVPINLLEEIPEDSQEQAETLEGGH